MTKGTPHGALLPPRQSSLRPQFPDEGDEVQIADASLLCTQHCELSWAGEVGQQVKYLLWLHMDPHIYIRGWLWHSHT